MGTATLRILIAAAVVSETHVPAGAHTYASGEPFGIGPFTLIPILVDHSAYAPHALLVEAGDERLLYSGGLRGHPVASRILIARRTTGSSHERNGSCRASRGL